MSMINRSDLLNNSKLRGIEIFQLTTETDIPSCHVYMEAQIFTPDSRHLVLHRSAHPHGREQSDPQHQYLLCDLENNGELSPLTDEIGAVAPVISPDGKWFYYFVDETFVGGGSFSLNRIALDGFSKETILKVDIPLPGCGFRPSQLYPLSTISSDGKRIAISCYLGDGLAEAAPWGLLVFDIFKATVNLILCGSSWCNIHPQYCRSTESNASHDLMIQENHGNQCAANGQIRALTGGAGADIHLIRDNGMNFRSFPWGRDKNEYCQGHQCWLGTSHEAITSTRTRNSNEECLVQASAVNDADHVGLNTPGGKRNELSRSFPSPHFYHFSTDLPGKHFISDYVPKGNNTYSLYTARFGDRNESPLEGWVYLFDTKSPVMKTAHVHPFLSPDGKRGFFNSLESGQLQAYMIQGLDMLVYDDIKSLI